MEKKDNLDFFIRDMKDIKLKTYEEELVNKKKYIEKYQNDPNPDNNTKSNLETFQTEIKNYNMRVECINKFNKTKTVPKIFVEDKYFNHEEIDQNKESDEKLYPDDKEISFYETNDGNKRTFVIKQRGGVSTCYFMAWILGLVNMGMGDYIKENIVREYDRTHAVVRLCDEDGLPVDIVVSKTRPINDKDRLLWLVMLDKAACVMMNRGRFRHEKEDEDKVSGAGKMNARIIFNVDWYQISKDQLDTTKDSHFKEGCFTQRHIGWSESSVGAMLIFGKQCLGESQFKTTNNTNDNMDQKLNFLKYCLSTKKLVVAATNNQLCGIPANHVVCFSKIVDPRQDQYYPDGYIEVIESYAGIHRIGFNDVKLFGSLSAANLPDFKEKELNKFKYNSEKELKNVNISKSDKNLYDNKNINLHSEINVCYNKSSGFLKNLEGNFKMQNYQNINKARDLNLSTFMDLDDLDLENQLNQSFDKLNCIIQATKQIQDEKQKIEKTHDNNETVVHTGTGYHGDILCFMNGAVSEIVEWDEKIINVVDARDGEILFSGTQQAISGNMGSIKQKLEKKYNERQTKLRELIYNLVFPQARKFMSDSGLQFDDQNSSISFNGVEIIWQDGSNSQVNLTFGFTQLINDTLTNLENLDQFNQDAITGAIKDAITKQINRQVLNGKTWCNGETTDKFINCWMQALSYVLLSNIFQNDLDLSLKKDFKVVLTHDCNIKNDLDPKKDLVRLTGDYIDRGDSSSEILCHIKNIHDKISGKAEQEYKPELKKCFVTTIGNHEVNFMAESDNDKYANRLCKNLIAQSYLVPGDVIESKDETNKNCTFSFSHTVMFKGSYPLILKQILELSELEEAIKPENINNSSNQIVVWIKSIFNDGSGNINNVGIEILKRIINRYNKVIADTKYKDLFQKFNSNNEKIQQILNQHIPDFSRQGLINNYGIVFNNGEQVYVDLKEVFNEKYYLVLKYLAMDVFCHPVVSDFDDKIKFLNDVELPKLNLLKFTFSEIGSDDGNYPPCFMSVTNISTNNKLSNRAPNNFTWEGSTLESFFKYNINYENKNISRVQHELDDVDKRCFEKTWPENIIQVHGHERRNDHGYLSQPDIVGSIAYNGRDDHKDQPDYKCSLIGTAHINLNDHNKSHTEVLQYNHLTGKVKTMIDNDKQQTEKLPLFTSPNDAYFENVPDIGKGRQKLQFPGQSNNGNNMNINNFNNMFLSWDINDNRKDLTVNAVMKGISLRDLKQHNFNLEHSNFSCYSVRFCPLETLKTVVGRWCQKNEFKTDEFIELIYSGKMKLKFGDTELDSKALDQQIENISICGINIDLKDLKNGLVLEIQVDKDTNLDDIKAKNFAAYFRVSSSGKRSYIDHANETQTLKEIIEVVVNNLSAKSRYDNIVDQIEKGNLKIIGKKDKEHVFKKDDLEKPFYKIIGNIDEFAVDGDESFPIIQLQITTLEIDQENINESNISSNLEQNHDLFQIQKNNYNPNTNRKESNWLFNALMLLAIIFVVLLLLAFMLKFAWVIKIIFIVIDVICCLPLIVLKFKNGCWRKRQSYRTLSNIYDPKTVVNNINNKNQSYLPGDLSKKRNNYNCIDINSNF